MKNLLLLLILTLTFLQTKLLADAPTLDENLPTSWYTLPEDGGGRSFLDPYPELSEKQKAGIDRVMRANSEAFSDFDSRSGDFRRGDWHLEACITDLSLSLSGVVGALVAKGETTVALYWRRAKQQDRTEVEVETDSVDAEFSSDDLPGNLEKRIEPLVQAVMATGRIKNESAVRKNLADKIFDSHELVQYLATVPQMSWKVNRLRMDLSIDVSGKVNPVTTVGGGVKIRLDWLLKAPTDRIQARGQRKLGDGLKKIAQDLVQILHETQFQDELSTGFHLREIKLGLGLFGEGNVGVVKLGGSLWGYLFIAPNPHYDEARAPKLPPRAVSIPAVDYTANADWTRWADANHFAYQTYASRDGGKVVVYSALSDYFKKGMEKAYKMGNRFAESAQKHKRRWEVYQLKTEFALSLTGDLHIFKLGGSGAVELVFGK